MRPLHRFVSSVVGFFAVWVALMSGRLDAHIESALPGRLSAVRSVVEAAPVYALIVLGCYALVSVGYALFTFRDCPEKREQLSRDIADAEAYLKQKGFVSPPPPAGWKA